VPNDTNAIEASSLLKRFSSFTALRNGSFTVPAGSITSFVGRNGAGKTTTLRIAATLLQQDDGFCRVLGHDTRTEKWTVRQKIGFVSDDPRVPGLLTLREYLSSLAGMYGVRQKDIPQRLESISELTGTGQWLDRRMRGLSRGEIQRVAIARALVNDPELVIMDEPTSGLDPQGRVEFKELLVLLHDRGKTIFISSHLLFDVEEISDRVVLIDKGEVKFEGGVGDLKRMLGSSARWRLGFAAGVPEHIAVPPGCKVVARGDSWVEIQGLIDESSRASWLAALISRGVPVCELTHATLSLEALFAQSFDRDGEQP